MFRRSLVYAIAVVVKLWLISGLPVTAIYGPHDDYLFVRQALSILDGKWLGQFSHLTLAKGPFFPIWLASINMLGLPYVLALQLSYLAACVAFVIAVLPLCSRESRTTIDGPFCIFLALWFSPSSFVASDFRVERSALYPSLVLLTIAFAVGLSIRVVQRCRPSLLWSAGLGLSFTAFWLTREEGVWLIPTLVLIFIGALIYGSLEQIRTWILSATITCLAIAVPAVANHFSYKRFMVIQSRDAAFVEGYRAITRVSDEPRRLMVPMPASAIDKAATVSPAFAEIRSALLLGYPSWRIFAKTVWAPMYPDGLIKQTFINDSEAIGGYFLWDFLAAVEQAGYYRNAASAHDYYLRLAKEINAACDSRRIACRATGDGLTPGWSAIRTSEFVSSLTRALQASFIIPPVEFPHACENLAPQVLSDFRLITRSAIKCTSESRTFLKGWILSKHGDATLAASRDGNQIWRLPGFIASPDVASQFAGTAWELPHTDHARFEADVPCTDCDLTLEVDRSAVKSAPIVQWQTGCPEGDGWRMCIDEISQPHEYEPRLVRMLTRFKHASLSLLGIVYRYGVLAIATAAFLVILLRGRRISDRRALALLFAVACILGVNVRALLLAWVDAVSFPSVLLQYSHASYVLLLTGTVFLVFAAAKDR